MKLTNEQKRRIASEYEWKNRSKDFAIAKISIIEKDSTRFRDDINAKFEVGHSSGGVYTPMQLKIFIDKLKKAALFTAKLNK